MKAKVGDWLVIKGTTIDQPDQRGLISGVHSPDGALTICGAVARPGHVAPVSPGVDAVVVTAVEQADADECAQHRFGAVQSTIAHDKSK
ncbi:hypothetical protein MMAN_26680 [Mycobacterium mantenii]|uniref:DUF1918 domain-containing protein n=1 Tax=Mycobacterium mantenii TaxID=560555 RepID=A0A1X0FB10_MYCNT|nr:DUF1918 domain-containing protein [Mycobacterium mantenii]MCV7241190.1 DUF1918 domain-containing protein [Mycobacterium mantenii]ORA98379.1 hypothetical protein BST30_25850 [Mycobacterium mantenii]BBY38534.1 hypothetical protein MMAN_26680 [Mycobacterium mantenii]